MSNHIKEVPHKGIEFFLENIDNASLNAKQKQAIHILKNKGIPTRRVEEWKYTDLRWLNQYQFTSSNTDYHQEVADWLNDNIFNCEQLSTLPRIVTVNGKVNHQYSNILTNSDFDIIINSSCYGELANSEDIMTALNYVMGHEGLALVIQSKQQAGTILLINLGYANSNESIAFHPRFSLTLKNNSQLSVVEFNVGEGVYFTNPVIEVNVHSYADFQYSKLINSSLESFICSNIYVELADHAKYRQFIMTKGAFFSRQEINVSLKGEWSEAAFYAVQTLHGRQHADITTVFSHLVPHCQSEQNVKNILSDQSHGVFQGKVFVDQQAQKTNAQQQNQALLLSDQAEINAKPELEIYADDVKCSHGATVGALDQEQLFFLMSRGIPYELARQILINAFISTAIEVVEDPISKMLLKEQLGVEIVEDIT